MGAAAAALAALEIAVAGRGAALARLQLVGVHRQTHRAACQTPLEPRVEENLRQPFRFGLRPHQTRARHHHRAQALLDLVALQDGGGGAQILDPAVGARSDEHGINRDVGQLHARRQPHVGKAALHRLDLAAGEIRWCGHGAGDRQHIFGAGAPSHHRGDVLALQRQHLVEPGTFVGIKGFPPRQCRLPHCPFGRVRAAHAIGKRGLVGRDDPGPRPAFDRHVAHRHAAFHRQIADRAAAVFDDMAGAACRSGRADHRKGNVLGGDAGAQVAGDLDLHVPGFLLDQGLRRQHMLDFRGADAMRQRPERAMRRGVAIPADHGHARQGPALFGADDVNDALAHIGHRVIDHPEIAGVAVQRLDLDAAFLVVDMGVAARRGGHVVIGHGDGLFGAAHLAVGQAQALEGLRAGDFVHQMAVDIEQAGAVFGLAGDVGIPDLVIEGFQSGHGATFG